MFVLFDTSSIDLFHECSSLLKKEKKILFLFHITKQIFFFFLKLSTNLDFFSYKTDLVFFFFHINQKNKFYFVPKQI